MPKQVEDISTKYVRVCFPRSTCDAAYTRRIKPGDFSSLRYDGLVLSVDDLPWRRRADEDP